MSQGQDMLAGLDAWSVDQNDLEQDITSKTSELMNKREMELEEKRLEKIRTKIANLNAHIALLDDKIADPATKISHKEKLRDQVFDLQRKDLQHLQNDQRDILERISERAESASGPAPQSVNVGGAKKQVGESEHEFLVRTGKITPFAKNEDTKDLGLEMERSHRELARPSMILERSVKKPRLESLEEEAEHEAEQDIFVGTDESTDEEDWNAPDEGSAVDLRHDDGNIKIYERRLSQWIKARKTLRKRLRTYTVSDTNPEWTKEHPQYPDAVISKAGHFRIPGDIWSSLFGYQKTGVRWLWELYSQRVGGIVGDEMGLGKTVQIAAFLAGLHYSGKLKRPALIVCPATVLHQWVTELHQWWPPLRVAILHSIGSGMGETGRTSISTRDLQDEDEGDEEDESGDSGLERRMRTSNKMADKKLISSIFETGHVIVTTYAGLKTYGALLLNRVWGYCCLDEGHKIRNPNSIISLTAKQIKTPYRVILSGTPIQNNLTELWSLFDFVFPGKLGTLPVFQTQFSVPINVGGYANATNIQVQTAYKCAVVLRDTISPYLLRRMKSDVASDLPQKTEKVLFCKLTQQQAQAYNQFLSSRELESILTGRRKVLFGIDLLRKICNHPDLLLEDKNSKDSTYGYGDPAKSGKMQVVKALLNLWTVERHKALLFTQTRQVLDILEKFAINEGIKFLRMDGTTPISHRQRLVDEFNTDPSIELFLLTTKVGGLGVNLTGADRVIIFDPDWNPSTDVQARERAWRLGQKNEVMIYRLMIAGSIEEKIYHRQIFKQFLTNKILKDPKQKRFFKTTDLHDLFSLGEDSYSEDLFGSASKKLVPSAGAKEDDVSAVAGIMKQGDYKSEDTGNEGKTESDSLLEGLFAKAGVQSSLEHDALMDASRPDTVLMEREATRIAHQAAQALKESRRATRRAKLGTPTWTGRFGMAGRYSPSKSSSSILQNLRQKRDLETKVSSQLPVSDENLQEHARKLEKIRSFLGAQPDCRAKSAEIVQNCEISLEGEQEVANLRRMLRQLATWVKDATVWELRPEFR